jgi:hypothetical protein
VAGIHFIRYEEGPVTEGWEDIMIGLNLASITKEQANSFASENYWMNLRFKCELFMAWPCVVRGWETA